ncbi:ankyrin [Coniochaeta ligniaria NRRL 30616]|uniref:Ankyrin n=1 Tax=Coniochaeta ligniaria NRRL 30616 TaxID=1408157 RepID=A0A1J7IYA0_9PEZI|nr:ankyrin [Coniochaeta ligniaria NRRL 30616]
MENTPTLGPSDVGPQDPGNDTLVSAPAERGTPRAALVDALFSEDVERCREILDAHPDLVNTPLRHLAHGRVPLHDSAWGSTYRGGYQHVTPAVFASLVPRFREERIDFRALSPSGLAIIALLVERGAALESTPGADNWTSYILTEVCRDYDSPEAMGLLVRIGADMHTRRLDQWSRTLLQVAAGRGAVGAVGFLLDRGVPMNYVGETAEDGVVNGTPLHYAAQKGRHQVVRLLLSRGALSDMESLDGVGRTPLLCAASGFLWEDADTCPSRHPDREETIRLLVDAGADLTASDRQDLRWSYTFHGSDLSDTPLGYISRWGSADIVRYVAGKGSDIHQQRSYPKMGCFPYGVGGDKATPLHMAAHNWNAAGVQALLDLGADPDATDEYGRQPLHWAALRPCLSECYTAGPRRTSYAWSELLADPRSSAYLAALAAMESTVSQLVVRNANLGRQDAFGRTPVHYAANTKLVGLVTLLLRKGVDLGLADNEGRTLLHHLADPIHRPRTNEPIDGDIEDEPLGTALAGRIKGVDVNHRDNAGSAALHMAARAASDAAVALLLGLGADPNLPDREGSTPLHLAAQRAAWVSLGTYEPHEYSAWSHRAARIKELLLGAGADASVRDARGRTAADVEEATDQELRQGRARYLEYLARPALPQGLDRGRGQWRRGPHAPPGDGGGHLASGAGHGRGG